MVSGMLVCPWCNFDLSAAPAGRLCTQCGRSPGAHSSHAAPAGGSRDLDIDLDFGAADAPAPGAHASLDLTPSFDGELQLAAPARAASVAVAPAAAAPPSGISALDDDDDFMNAGAGGSLSLDLDSGAGAGLPTGLSSASRIQGAGAGPASARAEGESDEAPPSVSSAVAALSVGLPDEIDPFEARALADYGSAPDNALLSPIYALRVVRRRADLGRALAIRRDQAGLCAVRVEEAQLAFAERARPVGERVGARTLEPVVAAEALLRTRDGALAQEMDAHRAELEKVDASIATVESELAVARAEEQVVADELGRAVDLKGRAEVKLKRAEIEIRNAMQLIEAKESQRGVAP